MCGALRGQAPVLIYLYLMPHISSASLATCWQRPGRGPAGTGGSPSRPSAGAAGTGALPVAADRLAELGALPNRPQRKMPAPGQPQPQPLPLPWPSSASAAGGSSRQPGTSAPKPVKNPKLEPFHIVFQGRERLRRCFAAFFRTPYQKLPAFCRQFLCSPVSESDSGKAGAGSSGRMDVTHVFIALH